MYKFKVGQEVTLLTEQENKRSRYPQRGAVGERFVVTACYDDGQYDIEPLEQEEQGYHQFTVTGDQIYPDHLAEEKGYQFAYWNGVGKYQKEYEGIFDRLVPQRGQAPTFAGEALRITARFYHDRFNNGDGNIYLPHFREMANNLIVCVKGFVADPDPLALRIAGDIGIGHATCQELDQFVDWLLEAIIRSEQPQTEEQK